MIQSQWGLCLRNDLCRHFKFSPNSVNKGLLMYILYTIRLYNFLALQLQMMSSEGYHILVPANIDLFCVKATLKPASVLPGEFWWHKGNPGQYRVNRPGICNGDRRKGTCLWTAIVIWRFLTTRLDH